MLLPHALVRRFIHTTPFEPLTHSFLPLTAYPALHEKFGLSQCYYFLIDRKSYFHNKNVVMDWWSFSSVSALATSSSEWRLGDSSPPPPRASNRLSRTFGLVYNSCYIILDRLRLYIIIMNFKLLACDRQRSTWSFTGCTPARMMTDDSTEKDSK